MEDSLCWPNDVFSLFGLVKITKYFFGPLSLDFNVVLHLISLQSRYELPGLSSHNEPSKPHLGVSGGGSVRPPGQEMETLLMFSKLLVAPR